MAIKRRHEIQVFSMSFIDCICCGFGAMILLLVLSQSKPPPVSEPVIEDDRGQSAEMRLLGEQTAGELQALEEALAAGRDDQRDAEQELIRLRVMADSLKNKTTESEVDRQATEAVEKQLASARQTLTEEMRRLQAQGVRVKNDAAVGGIPVDSEYIVFVVDTSGSMQRYAWATMLSTMIEILDLYPKVKGIQVMSDEGDYLFSSYRGQWIPDTPGRRKAMIEAMRNWKAFSDSSPVEGIEAAIRAFAAPDKKISVYVLGDDFTGTSASDALSRIRRVNPKDSRGVPRARIHAIGFPTQYTSSGITPSGIRFANLMRIMCSENGGAFVGLTSSS
ncbi:MAG: VWA domain-containing protein [Panacagrimonas sp.]